MRNSRLITSTVAVFCLSSGLMAQDNLPEEGSITNILWVRHGFSCANLIKSIASDRLNHFRSTYAPDSRVTDVGLEDAKTAGELIRKKMASVELKVNQDHVYTSTLLRPNETAAAVIYGWGEELSQAKINIVPYMSEKRIPIVADKDNLPRNLFKLINDLSNIEGAIEGLRQPTISPYKYGAYNLSNSSSFFGLSKTIINDPITTKPDKSKLLSITLPEIAKKDANFRDPNKMTIFVSHGHFINSITGIKPENVGAILQTLVFKNGKYKPTEQTMYFKGFSKIKAKNLKNGDFERCKFTQNSEIKSIMSQSDNSAIKLKKFFSF